jgi:WD40 repeat protein
MSVRQVAGYTIVREHGRGAMGTVYQALSPEHETVALKVLAWPEPADARARWEMIERFQREARAARALSHPNICRVLDYGCHHDTFFIVMEFLDGETIRELLDQAGPIGPKRAAEIVTAAAEGLAHAHEQGVIHRDVKPQNIMILRRNRQVKLTDFGLAAIAQEQAGTQPGVGMGTPGYWSPEQARGEPADARSDIFSLGATCCEMLTGSPPPPGEIPQAVREQWPGNVSRVVQKCLRREPRERFQSARELIASLRDRPSDTRPLGPGPPEPGGRLGRLRRRLLSRRVALLAAIAVLLVIGTAVLRPRNPVTSPEQKFPPGLTPHERGVVATTIYTGAGRVEGIACMPDGALLAAVGAAEAVPPGVYRARAGDSWDPDQAYGSPRETLAAPGGIARFPDGRVVVADKSRSTVWLVPSPGHPPEVLTTKVPSPSDVAIAPPGFRGPQVEPGDVLVCADSSAGSGGSGLYVVKPKTHAVTRLVGPPELPRGVVHIACGPNGTVYAVEDDTSKYWCTIVTATPRGQITRYRYNLPYDLGLNTGPIAVDPKTGEVYFAHDTSILQLPAGGGDPREYAGGGKEEITALEFSPDGGSLLVGLWTDRGGGTIARIAPYPIEGRLLISSSHQTKPPSAPQEFAYLLAGNSASIADVVTFAPKGMAAGGCDLSPVAGDLMLYITEGDVGESWQKTSRIWRSDLDGLARVPLGPTTGINCLPLWSPDGKQIAFLHCDPIVDKEPCEIGLDVWVMNADGTAVKRVARPTRFDRLGSLSFPDFSWWREGRGFRLKHTYGIKGRSVIGSPDGTKTVASRTRKGRYEGERGVWRQLCIGDSRGRNEHVRVQWFVKDSDIATYLQRFHRGPSDSKLLDDAQEWLGPLKPRWSPSGRYVAFLAAHPFRPEAPAPFYKYQLEVWVYELSTGILARLTDNEDQESTLSWQPDPVRPDPAGPGR